MDYLIKFLDAKYKEFWLINCFKIKKLAGTIPNYNNSKLLLGSNLTPIWRLI